MIPKRRLDGIGGVASILIGIGCAWIGFRDWQVEHSVWKVFAVMCVVLLLNGVAMIRYSMRPGRPEESSNSRGGIVRGSSRV